MQFYLDDSVPIRLYTTGNAPRRQPLGQAQVQAPSMAQAQPLQQRSVPGYPYIRFIDENDLEGGYPFDAFQDLRSAYYSSPLNELQSRMRSLQEQRAQAQLRRALLEQQLREQQQRERELYEYQRRLEQERRAHARDAANRARAAYLSRLAKEEKHRQLEALNAARRAAIEKANAQKAALPVAAKDNGSDDDDDDENAVYYPPFHFFNHILNNQIKSQDDIERKRAEKSALTNLLESYFGAQNDNAASTPAPAYGRQPESEKQADEMSTSQSPVAPASMSLSPEVQQPTPLSPSTTENVGNDNTATASAARSLPPFGVRSAQLDSGVLENVLRVVHDRLAEIAAEEGSEKSKEDSDSATEDASAEPAGQINVDVVKEPKDKDTADSSEQRDIEIEEPVDYSKLADSLRRRVSGLNDDNIFLPLSPLLGSHDGDNEDDDDVSETDVPSFPQPKVDSGDAEQADQEMEVDDNAAEHSDHEFASLLNSCKSQLSEMKDSTKQSGKSANTSSRAHRRRRNRHHPHRRHNIPVTKPLPSSAKSSKVSSVAKEDVTKPTVSEQTSAEISPEIEEQLQKPAANNAIEDYILGSKGTSRSKEAQESLRTLSKIDRELEKIRGDYNWRLRNMQLSFVADKSGNLKLAYNRGNKAFHEYQEVLQRLLMKLDEIQSYGDDTVRIRRKTIVKKIQNTLDALDQFAADQESELSESSTMDVGSLADESSNGEWVA
ncbi:hypothetical protein IW150_002921 [Coemansia sp. RSA 2607]|nr:hypothetical protein IW150_002921 [Coemansia sp. RSA 2607]